ncbi:surface antigen-like protein [Leptomonas pyrrhocoris]|uniref:Surface antigen-like protein n=1 Tax=Leptomonas pyrrhocoris TaxID=157538 RepID=A0A0N0DTT4_LEPPY|nr:surface antigen-like protein [Leptomonas pyrrhocoris]KPA77554.1 surface antigen-like protein [Leptomonas pyrrhocoris]|eukprot:XP_015655993.1 surface antigen-like protein [Leptomonas pyrrhocoris]
MTRIFRCVLLAPVVVLVLALLTSSVTADFTEARFRATYLFLSAFPYALPSLQSTWRAMEFCSWPGVACDNSSAITYVSVNLAGQNLQGRMPSVANEVTGYNLPVVSVDLSNNPGITGPFNDDWAALMYVTHIDLSYTHLQGSLPDSWNRMVNLATLKITYTFACKGLPNWNIASLRTVDLSHNRLRGVLASSWSNMTGLTSVDISGNDFCGCVPSTWSSSAVLTNAAAAVGNKVVASNCESANKCTSSHYMCTSAAAAPASVALLAGLLLSFLVAIAAL